MPMPTVYVRGDKRLPTFHRDASCRQITRKTTPPRTDQEVRAVDLRDLDRCRPCGTCFPDAPKARSAHRFCPQCNKDSARPCAHNGGVPVWMVRTRRKPSLFMDEGETYARYDYVWPEMARFYASTG